MSLTIDERVEIGTRFLDDTVPNWRDVVSANHMNMGDCDTCVLGLVLGWQEGVETLYAWWTAQPEVDDCIMPRLVEVTGFEITDETYAELQAVWERVIANEPECDGCDQDPWRAPVHYGTCPLNTTKENA